jgi:hypothetical protein
MKKISSLSRDDVIGQDFMTDDGVHFTVLEADHYPQSAIARQHQKYCEALREGILVSLSFRGKPVPVVKVSDGVMRLKRIMLTTTGVELGNTSTEVSQLLGVLETRQPMGLYHT